MVTPAPKNLQKCSSWKLRIDEMTWASMVSLCLLESFGSYGSSVELKSVL